MEILGLIDKLETLVTSSARLPATRKTLLDMDKVLELVDQIRLAVPKDVQEAEELLMRRESVVNQALLDARRIKAAADEESRSRLAQSEIVKEASRKGEEVLSDAKRRADSLLQDAQKKAHQVMKDAEAFADSRVNEATRYTQEMFLQLEEHLSNMQNSVRRGLDAMDAEQEKVTASAAKPA